MNKLTKIVAVLASLCLMDVPACVRADFAPGTRVPVGTSAGQTLVWNASGWTIAPVVYNGNNLTLPAPYTLGVGGVSDGSAVYVAPSGAAQTAVKILVPAGSTANAFQVSNTAQPDAFTVAASGIISFPGSDSNNNPGFHFNSVGKTDNFGRNLGLGLGTDYAVTASIADFGRGWVISSIGVIESSTDGSGNTFSRLSTTSPTINATTKFQAGGTDGYTGNIPSTAQSTHVKGGIIVGFTAADGSTVGQ